MDRPVFSDAHDLLWQEVQKSVGVSVFGELEKTVCNLACCVYPIKLYVASIIHQRYFRSVDSVIGP